MNQYWDTNAFPGCSGTKSSLARRGSSLVLFGCPPLFQAVNSFKRFWENMEPGLWNFQPPVSPQVFDAGKKLGFIPGFEGEHVENMARVCSTVNLRDPLSASHQGREKSFDLVSESWRVDPQPVPQLNHITRRSTENLEMKWSSMHGIKYHGKRRCI